MVRKYKDLELLNKVKQLSNYKKIPTDKWILGVRSLSDVPDKFDDKFYVFKGEEFISVMTGTTHPGVSILKSFEKFNKLGAAVVQADTWYYNLWTYGLHKGKMPALIQTGAAILVHRDGNKNLKSESIGDSISGFYGINFHTNTYDFSSENLKIKKDDIGGWSAGCQVVNDRIRYEELMKDFKKMKVEKQQQFVSYCLINEF